MAVRYGSVCSGVEAASLAWEPLGWTPAFFAEVDPFCCKLLAHRWPRVPNLGDLTSDTFAERAAACGPVDVLVGGTPCQSFSVAGKRGGLADPRGDLTLRYIEIIGRLRPAWFVWENVPGVLSQDGGRAFGAILGKMADLGYRLAWRVLDAALHGVPQRRRRVFVVGCLGTRCPGKILALAEGEGRDPEPGGAAGAEVTAGAGGGAAAITSGYGKDRDLPTAFSENRRAEVRLSSAVDSLTVGGGKPGQGYPEVLTEAVGVDVYNQSVSPVVQTLWAGQKGHSGAPAVVLHPAEPVCVTGRVTHALASEGADASEDGTGRGTPLVAFHATAAVALPDGGSYVVRRLMPVECERLQGMPDGHTLIPARRAGRKRRKDREYAEIGGEVWELAADAPRYRAIGNSMAVPVMRAIGERIAEGGVRWR